MTHHPMVALAGFGQAPTVPTVFLPSRMALVAGAAQIAFAAYLGFRAIEKRPTTFDPGILWLLALVAVSGGVCELMLARRP